MKISKEELKQKYGIDLEKGLYSIEYTPMSCSIFQIKDDTLGCVLIGDNTAKGCLTNSRVKTQLLYDKMRFAISKGEKIYIKIY